MEAPNESFFYLAKHWSALISWSLVLSGVCCVLTKMNMMRRRMDSAKLLLQSIIPFVWIQVLGQFCGRRGSVLQKFHRDSNPFQSTGTGTKMFFFQLDSRENVSSSREPSLHIDEPDSAESRKNFSPVASKGEKSNGNLIGWLRGRLKKV